MLQEAIVVHAVKIQVKEWRGNFNVGFEHDLTSTERGLAGGKYVYIYIVWIQGWWDGVIIIEKLAMKNYEDIFVGSEPYLPTVGSWFRSN